MHSDRRSFLTRLTAAGTTLASASYLRAQDEDAAPGKARKKVAFLQEFSSEVGLPVRAIHGRAEEVSRTELGASFDVVTARAVAPLERLVGWTVPFLRPGGFVYAIKGERWQEELAAAGPALREWGAEAVATPQELGDSPDGVRPLVVIIRRTPRAGTSTTEGNR